MVWSCKEREGEGLLGEVMELEVTGVRHSGRPRKQWNNHIEENLREMNLRETDAMNRDGWRTPIKSSNPVTWREDVKQRK